MSVDPDSPPTVGRLFLTEPGWRVELKVGSDREYCFLIAPGQDFYHRLGDGEIVVRRGDERLCLACAGRRGLLVDRPKTLRATLGSVEFEAQADDPGFELGPPPG